MNSTDLSTRKVDIDEGESVLRAFAPFLRPMLPAVGLSISLLSSVASSAQTISTIYDFPGTAGSTQPIGHLVAYRGMLYGETYEGGPANEGTIFGLDPATGKEKKLHAFGSGTDGYYPSGGMIVYEGKLYGATIGGGAKRWGTIFALDPKTGVETAIYSFGASGDCDGIGPNGGVIEQGGMLYGTTAGTNCSAGGGTVFAIAPTGGSDTVLYVFNESNGDASNPRSRLVYANGSLYGTSYEGGVYGGGAVFSVGLGGGESVLHSFPYYTTADGAAPLGGLTYANGALYGTTTGGGASGCGTVFKIESGGTESIVHNFACTKDGVGPETEVVVLKRTLYGTTLGGPAPNNGTLYGIDLATGTETILFNFNFDMGTAPNALLYNEDSFYASANGGGTSDNGTVFRFVP